MLHTLRLDTLRLNTPRLSTLRRTTGEVQALVLALVPHGGQRSARQNAWASMSEGAVRARGRREADLAMDRAVLRNSAAARAAGQSAR